MRKLVETVLENASTKEIFLFRVSCAGCGLEYGNQPIRFSKAGKLPESSDQQILYAALYEQELRDARLTAIRCASEQMNFCPICKQLVCNRCFLICDELDMCRQCAEMLRQPGQPVFPKEIEATAGAYNT